MHTVEIRISGPGSCINNELVVVKKALQDIGYEVEVINKYPVENSDLDTEEKQFEFVKGVRKDFQGKVRITMDHIPWGS